MARSDADRWNARYAEQEETDSEPIPFLVDRAEDLGSGKALVLAAGTGRNAVYLGGQGFDVTALDVSSVGLEKCRRLADDRGVRIQTLCADLKAFDLGESEYDLITKIYFYQPSLFPSIRRALKPGGRFFFQTFSRKHAEVGTFGPKNPDYLAHQAAVIEPFTDDRIRYYEETVEETDADREATIRMIAERR